ncbi:uncharacterized protein [Polyergus mexicanus]|uniref:uncharacterized protein n=1 Tax=Polyergus mexicanus TaxID=615972 RepID=UPI0038B44B7A
MENVEQTERDLLELSRRVATLGEYFAWAQRCEEFSKQLEEHSRVKRPRLSIGVRQSLVARIARLEGARTRLEKRFIHSGGDYSGDNTAERLTISKPRQFLEDAKDIVLKYVQKVMERHNNVKVNTVFNGEFVSGDKSANKSVNTKNYELFRTSDLHEWYERCVVEPTLASLEEFQERDSGWALSRILDLTVNINKYNPMGAGCHIKLPREITMKRMVINVQSKDNACFAWAVVAALYPAERNAERESLYPHYTTVLNLQDIEFPMTLSQIKKFEIHNNISLNVYCIEKENNIVRIRLSEQKKDRHVNLLYMQDSQDVGHFAWIKNLSRLVSSQLSKKDYRKYICDRCLHYFGSEDKLQSHIVDCREMNECAIRLPSDKDKWLAFNNYNRKERLPFVVYADLECVLRKTDGDPMASTYTFQHHQVFSVAYYVHCSYDESLSEYHSRLFHNLSGYDSHFIIEEIATAFEDSINVLPITKEKYISFTKHVKDTAEISDWRSDIKLRFIDSYKFLSTSLEKLASFLNNDKLQILKSKFQNLSIEEYNLLTRKGVFPYEYIDCLDRLHDTCLPPRESFYSSLTATCSNARVAAFASQRYIAYCNSLNPHGSAITSNSTQFRTRATNDFEKNLYKLMNNAVFGKTMENVRNHVDVKLLTKWDGRYGAEAMIAKPNFRSRSIFSESLVAVELRNLEVKFNKPIYVDSLIYHIECEDVYENMKRDIARFDTSDYPANNAVVPPERHACSGYNNAYGIPLENKKVPGLMKDENNGAIMTEFVGLRAKMYALRVNSKKDTKKVKGVKSNVVARTITFDDYTRCLRDEIEMTRQQSCIRSKLHEVYTISETKIALNQYDDKRYIVPDSTDTLPWGHYRIPL